MKCNARVSRVTTGAGRHYLRRGNLRTGEIAYLLGYEDTNSFYRAFRSWTGTTPETLRVAAAS